METNYKPMFPTTCILVESEFFFYNFLLLQHLFIGSDVCLIANAAEGSLKLSKMKNPFCAHRIEVINV